jgi:hypothetical protein
MQNKAASRRYDYARANIEISGRNAAGLERERCRLRSRGAAENLETMPSGPFLFTSNRGNLRIWHKRHSENDSDYFSGAGSSRVSASSKDRRVFSGHLRARIGSDFRRVSFGSRGGQVLAEAALARFSTADRLTELISNRLQPIA